MPWMQVADAGRRQPCSPTCACRGMAGSKPANYGAARWQIAHNPISVMPSRTRPLPLAVQRMTCSPIYVTCAPGTVAKGVKVKEHQQPCDSMLNMYEKVCPGRNRQRAALPPLSTKLGRAAQATVGRSQLVERGVLVLKVVQEDLRCGSSTASHVAAAPWPASRFY